MHGGAWRCTCDWVACSFTSREGNSRSQEPKRTAGTFPHVYDDTDGQRLLQRGMLDSRLYVSTHADSAGW